MLISQHVNFNKESIEGEHFSSDDDPGSRAENIYSSSEDFEKINSEEPSIDSETRMSTSAGKKKETVDIVFLIF